MFDGSILDHSYRMHYRVRDDELRGLTYTRLPGIKMYGNGGCVAT